nr:NAD(P)-dependent oxidoreductase [Actinomadura madurae]
MAPGPGARAGGRDVGPAVRRRHGPGHRPPRPRPRHAGRRSRPLYPGRPSRHPRAGHRAAPLERTVAESDVLSVHLPATEATTGLVDADLLARCKPGAILVSVGRGEVVDERALAEALESGHLAGAALDVRAAEPPAAGPLERMPNVVLTPHVAGITVQSQARIAQILCDDIEAVLDDRVPAHAVTPVQEGRR